MGSHGNITMCVPSLLERYADFKTVGCVCIYSWSVMEYGQVSQLFMKLVTISF